MEQQTVSLKQCISEVTGKQIAMDGDIFIYLREKTKVEQSIIDEALILVEKYNQEQLDTEAKQAKIKALNELTVTTTNGNTFDANTEAITNMLSVLQASQILNQTTTNWKLADNTVVMIDSAELQEAHALAIQAKGAIILGV
jgi:hypothetical protein